jgi:hypothetical protein
MSKKSIIVLIEHRHKLLDLIGTSRIKLVLKVVNKAPSFNFQEVSHQHSLCTSFPPAQLMSGNQNMSPVSCYVKP